MSDKINLAVMFYGNRSQAPLRLRQFSYLQKCLTDFKVKKYYFNQAGRKRVLADFRAGTIDAVLKNSHGREHEADIELFLEKHHIPFLGSGSRSTLAGTSKHASKTIFRKKGLPVAPDLHIVGPMWLKSRSRLLARIANEVGYPCLIKEVGGSDSRGLYYTPESAKMTALLDRLAERMPEVIVEKFITGAQELTCMVVGNERAVAYEPVEYVKERDLFSAEDKDRAAVSFRVPAALKPTLIRDAKSLAVKAHRALACRTFSRADILVKGRRLYLLEVDVHPGFQSISPTFKSAKYVGENPNELFLKFYKLIL